MKKTQSWLISVSVSYLKNEIGGNTEMLTGNRKRGRTTPKLLLFILLGFKTLSVMRNARFGNLVSLLEVSKSR